MHVCMWVCVWVCERMPVCVFVCVCVCVCSLCDCVITRESRESMNLVTCSDGCCSRPRMNILVALDHFISSLIRCDDYLIRLLSLLGIAHLRSKPVSSIRLEVEIGYVHFCSSEIYRHTY